MNATDFISSNSYLYLPTVKNPKVALAVDNSDLAENAFKLYNPFSVKGKILKKISRSSFIHLNSVSKIISGSKKQNISAFVRYLENKLGKPLVASVYFSTINDKVVLQLQTLDAEIVGYLKYPLNAIGLKHLDIERQAIEILCEKKIVQKFLLHDVYDGTPFLLLATLEGKIGLVKQQQINDLLSQFKRDKTYILSEHPRVKELHQSLISNSLSKYIPLLESITQNSDTSYALVYEHGDFAPWNIVNVDDEYIPFDFEYFVKDGLEYFDLIKFYYQIGKLLEGKRNSKLSEYIQKQVDAPGVLELLQLFLIKEIVRGHEEGELFNVELELLEYLGNK